MNENLPPKAPVINSWVGDAIAKLKEAGIDSARLDAELILAHTLNKPRTYLHAHGDDNIANDKLDIANAKLSLRLDRVPAAYIIGHKEFYGRRFKVTPNTLIPRPESEDIIDLAKEIIKNNTFKNLANPKLIDIGTGSGCIGITAKLEITKLDVTLIDISQKALNIAQKNAKLLGANVAIEQSDLLSSYSRNVDIIVANLPYVDYSWQCSPETKYEPALALFAQDDGLYLIKKLVTQAHSILGANGVIILESDKRQHDAISQFAIANGYGYLESRGLILTLKKIS